MSTENNHTDRKHSWLSPSGMAPIMAGCVGKPRMEKGLPDRTNPAAERGTRIHEIAEKLFKQVTLPLSELDQEELEEAKAYYEYVNSIAAGKHQIFTELDVEVFPELQIRGHVDNIVWDAENLILHVIDLKTGSNKVDVMNNPQLLSYSYGGYLKLPELLGHNVDVKEIVLHVFQYGTGYKVGYDTDEILNAVNLIRTNATKAFEIYNRELEPGISELKENKSCIWCKAKRNCPVMLKSIREKAQINLAQLEVINAESPLVSPAFPTVELLSDEQKIKIIKYKKMIEALIEDVELDLLDRLEKGEVIEGVTIKQGKEVREWGKVEEVSKALFEMGVDPYETKLITITKAEKVLGKGKLEGLTQLKKQKSSLQLVK